jgi:hypothetical protein
LHFHSITLGDYDRLEDLEQVNARFAGQGPALFPNFDEFGEYVLRDAGASGLVNPAFSRMKLNRTATPGLQTVRDTDEFDQRFLQTFRLIIRRRDPTASRPPSDFRLAAVTRDYEVWRRVGDPRTVAAHFPLKNLPDERTPQFCREVAGAVRQQGSGARIAYAVPKRDVVGVPAAPQAVPPSWTRRGDDLVADSPGRLTQDFPVPATGTYRLFIRGSFGRGVVVSVDGRQVGSLRWRESYPGQFVALGTRALRAGTHSLTIERGGGGLLPGTGNDPTGMSSTIGPVVLDPQFEQARVRTAPASEAASVCGSSTRLDWIEVLRPRAR